MRLVNLGAIALLLGSVMDVAAADTNLDIVLGCIAKHGGESKAVEACARQRKPIQRLPNSGLGQVELGSGAAAQLRGPLELEVTAAIDSWRVNKKLSAGEKPHHQNNLMKSPNKDSFRFCGYKVFPDTVYNSGWQVLNPNDQNVSIVTTTGDHLVVDFKVRWISKHAAGNSKEDINCEGDGWRVNPTYEEGNYVGQYTYAGSTCLLFVKVCHRKDPGGTQSSEFCGICAGFSL